MSKGNMRQSRSVPAGFRAVREKSKSAFLEPSATSLSKTLPTNTLQSLLQGQGTPSPLAHTLPSSLHPLQPGVNAPTTQQLAQVLGGPQPPPAPYAHPPPSSSAQIPDGESGADTQSESPNKRRRRYSNVKRRSVVPSPKPPGGSKTQGQSKASGASDSDAERSKPRRRKRRMQRRVADLMDTSSLPASDVPPGDGEGDDLLEEGMGQGQLGTAVESTPVRLTPRKRHRAHPATRRERMTTIPNPLGQQDDAYSGCSTDIHHRSCATNGGPNFLLEREGDTFSQCSCEDPQQPCS
ncbi:hypothetical protein BaRGS_00015859 [Batillaria attramentaria]|uniref:Uncharacterized protein n=1 Tax=Batillaria attramentaria TaxID=370345 RepID=A0ABD0L1H4_9CAEN